MVPPSVDQAGAGVNEGEPCAASSSLPFEGCVGNATRPTPPGPPFTRGGKVMVPPSVDQAGVGVSEGEPCAASSSLPFEGCVGNATRPTPSGPPFTRGGKDALDHGCSSSAPPVRPIGLVGPMSNFVAPPQLVENVPYRDVIEMQRFARRWRDEHRKQWFTVPRLSGFCLLLKRAVYDKIGGLDERFGLGLFDDDDLAERARRAGFELAVAHDLFVHHFGRRTFLGNGVDSDTLFEENARRFAAKWGSADGNNGRERVVIKPWRGPERAVCSSASAGASAEPCATPGGRGSVRAALDPGSAGASPSPECPRTPQLGGRGSVRAALSPRSAGASPSPECLRTPQLGGRGSVEAALDPGSAGASPSPECPRTPQLAGRGSVEARSTPAHQSSPSPECPRRPTGRARLGPCRRRPSRLTGRFALPKLRERIL